MESQFPIFSNDPESYQLLCVAYRDRFGVDAPWAFSYEAYAAVAAAMETGRRIEVEADTPPLEWLDHAGQAND